MARPISPFDSALADVAIQQEAPACDASQDRRLRARRPFRCEQWVAPGDGESIPPPDRFAQVHCYDLSTTGIALLYPSAPRDKRLVIGLGRPPCLVYLAAEVVHCTKVMLYAKGKVVRDFGFPVESNQPRGSKVGQPMMLVGCRFIERLEQEIEEPSPESPA